MERNNNLAVVEDDGLVPGDRDPVLVYLGRLRSDQSRATMVNALEQASRLLTNGSLGAFGVPWETVNYQHQARLQNKLLDVGYSPATANKILTAVRGVRKQCRLLGTLSHDEHDKDGHVANIRFKRQPAGRMVPTAELEAVLAACLQDETPAGIRDAAMIGVMVTSGVRREEAAHLMVGDIVLGEIPNRGEIFVRSGKGDKDRTTYCSPDAATLLERWLIIRTDAPGPVFVPVNKGGRVRLTDRPMALSAINDALAKRCELAGVMSFSPHDLRRTFTSELLDRGADLLTAQKMLGHADPRTTAMYDRRGLASMRQASNLIKLPI